MASKLPGIPLSPMAYSPRSDTRTTSLATAPQIQRNAHFVLVHGLGHGAWCWYKVRSHLESAGHKVSCVDLLASGVDSTPCTSVGSFDDYNRPLYDLLQVQDDPTQDHDAKVILVGHSLGCRSLSRLLHDPRSLSRLAAVVYIAGSMVRIQLQEAEELGLGLPDTSDVRDVVTWRPDGVLSEESQRLLLYGTSPPEDAILASMLLRPGPPPSAMRWEPGEGDLQEPMGEVKRVYVKTNRDMVWKPWQQQKMVDLWPPSKVFALDTDHSPFFSAPRELSDALLHVAADCGFS